MKSFDDTASGKTLDVKKLFLRALRYWYYFPVFLVLSTVIAFTIYKTTVPLHHISTQVLISSAQDAAAGRVDVGERALPGISLGGQSHFENQTIILTSRRQVEKTIRELDFEVSYYEKEAYRLQEIYKDSPFRVLIDSSKVKPAGLAFEVAFVSKDRFVLKFENSAWSKEYGFFEKVNHPRFSFSLVPVEDVLPGSGYEQKVYRFVVNDLKALAAQYKSSLFLDRVQHGSSIVELSILENNVEKGRDFLNRLAYNSVSYTLEKKNQIALNTIEFIEKQLIGVADSLGAAENILQDFRSRNVVMNVSLQGEMIMAQSKELEDQKSALLAKLDYYSYLNDYIEGNGDLQEVIVPTSMGIEDPVLSQLIAQLSTLNAERSALRFNATTANPNITRINASIENLKGNIIESLKSVISATNLSLNDINNRLYNLSGEIRKLPRTEQRLLNIERTRQMNNETYTFLLTKLTEAQLAKAANRPDNEIIEEATYRGLVAPDQKRLLMLVLLAGLFLPAVVVFIKVFSNDKVQEVDDLKELCDLPVLGQIPAEKKKSRFALGNKERQEAPQALLSESFRSMRTALGYYANKKACKVILITSTLPGEGKSFCALNLARSFAQLNKKTLVVEFDLRRPSLNRQSGIPAIGKGITSYYSSDEQVADLIVKGSEAGSPDFIFAGPLPPNPAEMIAGEATERLFGNLQELYEVIIVDTPPLGVVSDAFLLTSLADVNLLVSRYNVTPKPVFKMNLKDEKFKEVPHLGLIINGLPFHRKEYHYRYGYDAGSKYFAGAQ